jgi:hypothetical protein
MNWLRRVFGMLLVLLVGLAANGPAWAAGDFNGGPGSPSQAGNTSGDNQDDGAVAADLLYFHKRIEHAAPWREWEKTFHAPAFNEVPQTASTTVFSRSLPFLLSTGISAARAGLMPRAPSRV